MESTTLGYEWHGPPELEGRLHGIEEFQPHPRNVRKGNVDILARALQRFGQMSPIIVQRSTNNIVKGNHTWKAAVRLGWERIAAYVYELDDDTAYQYLLADNRASDLAEYDKEALVRSLQELADAGKLQGTLWTADDVDDLQAAIGTLQTLAQEFTGDYSDDPEVREQRQNRELTRVATKMREVPIVITVDQHRIFMTNLDLLRKEWHTSGTIETILLAVQKAADGYRAEVEPVLATNGVRADGPQPVEMAVPDQTPPLPPTTPLEPPSAPTGPIEPPPPTQQQVDQERIWASVREKMYMTFKALGTNDIKRTVAFGIIEAVTPAIAIATLEQAERRRAGVAIREAIIQQQDKATFTLEELRTICMSVQP